LQFLLETIYNNYSVIKKVEVTLEVNPDDLTQSSFRQREQRDERTTKNLFESYIEIGINRLSIGVQSFFEDDLKFMNRAHNSDEAKNCLDEAIKYFDNITIDLIYGIPNLTVEKWKKNLQIAFDLGINHISSYALTVEPKTALYQFIKSGKYPPLNEELALAHYTILVAETKKQGFVHYEISNFGKEGYFSKHNSSYWQGKKYLGIGPSAHSFNGKQRSWNINNNTKYIKAIQNNELPQEIEQLSEYNLFNEAVMIGLRTIWGISLTDIKSEFGQKTHNYLLKKAQKHIDNKTVEVLNNQLKTTPKGMFLSDGIASDLFLVS